MQKMNFNEEQEFERQWWGDCRNTYGEETKQFVYAKYMGLEVSDYSIDVKGKSIVDIGGGPCSLLLKCKNLSNAIVVDPCLYPQWIYKRYLGCKIDPIICIGENIINTTADEVWIYNCLQHTKNPKRIIENTKKIAPVLRIFEWIDIPPHKGHPHMLNEDDLTRWIDRDGDIHIDILSGEGQCFGRFYAGVFK